jgi:hypothetical protein
MRTIAEYKVLHVTPQLWNVYVDGRRVAQVMVAPVQAGAFRSRLGPTGALALAAYEDGTLEP